MKIGTQVGGIAVALCVACGGGDGVDPSAASGSATGATSTPGTGGGSTGGEMTSGGPTSGEATSGEPTSGGPTSGGPTSGGPTSGGPTSGETSGGPTSGDPGSSGDSTGGGQVCDGEVHDGKATYYAADGSGNCSFDANPGDPMVAAMNHTDYMASAACGACVQIDGPDGQITVRIVDRCPECEPGHIDLAEGAFPMIAPVQDGIVPITWRYVSCDVDGPIVYHFKEGSNQWWTAVQIRDHRNAIAALAFKNAEQQWQDVPRLDYNYFVADQGMGPGPYEFRVTDVHGNVLEDSNIPFIEAGDAPGQGQFPPCAP